MQKNEIANFREETKMADRKITENQIQLFHQYLIREEKSTATMEKSVLLLLMSGRGVLQKKRC